MKVVFKNVDSALQYGAPSPEEQQAILAMDRGDNRGAEAILDQVVAKNPDRVRNIFMYREPRVAVDLMLKYIVQTASGAQTDLRKTSLTSTSEAYNITAPPPYDGHGVTPMPCVVHCNSGGGDSNSKGVAPAQDPVAGQDEDGLRRRKAGAVTDGEKKDDQKRPKI